MSETRERDAQETELDDDFYDEEIAGGLYSEVLSSNYRSANKTTDQGLPLEFCSTETPVASDSDSKNPKETKETKDSKDAPDDKPEISEWDRMQAVNYQLRYIGFQLDNGLKILQDQASNKIPSPDRTGQPPLRDQIRDLNQQIKEIAKKSSPYATTDEKVEIAKDLQKALMQVYRIQYGLAPGAKDDAIWEEVRKDEAKKAGLPSDATFDQINEYYDKKNFEATAKAYGLDPKTATRKDLDAAVERLKFENECKTYKLDPKKATPELLEEAKEQFEFEQSCKLVSLDPKKTTREEVKLAVDKYWHELDCKELGLDPKTATKEDAAKTRGFNADCAIYNIDKNDKDAPQKIHQAKCAYYGLPPNASAEELKAKIDEDLKKYEKPRKR